MIEDIIISFKLTNKMVDHTLKPDNIASLKHGTKSRPKNPFKSRANPKWRVGEIIRHTEEPDGKRLNYLIKWKNQPADSNTWENADVFWRDDKSKRIQDVYLTKALGKSKAALVFESEIGHAGKGKA